MTALTVTEPILVVTTGGTIDKRYFDALSLYQVGEASVRAVLQEGRVAFPYEVREMFRKDSLEMNAADRAVLRDCIVQAQATRVLVTHGTDTMTQTARVLADIPGKTIVLTGALAPACFRETDAAFNLGMAFAAVQTAVPGTYITMNGYVFRAGETRKDRASGRFVPASGKCR